MFRVCTARCRPSSGLVAQNRCIAVGGNRSYGYYNFAKLKLFETHAHTQQNKNRTAAAVVTSSSSRQPRQSTSLGSCKEEKQEEKQDEQQQDNCTFFLDRSTATSSPFPAIVQAIWQVLPPGAAHMSSTCRHQRDDQPCLIDIHAISLTLSST